MRRHGRSTSYLMRALSCLRVWVRRGSPRGNLGRGIGRPTPTHARTRPPLRAHVIRGRHEPPADRGGITYLARPFIRVDFPTGAYATTAESSPPSARRATEGHDGGPWGLGYVRRPRSRQRPSRAHAKGSAALRPESLDGRAVGHRRGHWLRLDLRLRRNWHGVGGHRHGKSTGQLAQDLPG